MHPSWRWLTATPFLLASACPAAVIVGDATALANAVIQANAGGDPEILVRDGTYTLDNMLWIGAAGITVRSLSGQREAAVIRGQGMGGGVTHVFNVAADAFTARDLTLRDVSQHAVQLHVDVDRARLSNLHILDTGEQMVKVAYDPSNPGATSDDGVLESSLLEYSNGIGPQWYIGGIDAHNAVDWVVRGNVFRFIRSPGPSLAEHAVHFWSGSTGTLVERNVMVNCDRGVGFGLGDRGHGPGIIRNNLIYNDDTQGFADVGIGLESAAGVDVYNNTILLLSGYPNAIEYRFNATQGGAILNNLSNARIFSRDGGSAALGSNLTSADPAWFTDPPSGDLRLGQYVFDVIDQGQTVGDLVDDVEEEDRPYGSGLDLGADEWSDCVSSAPLLIDDRQFAAGTHTHCRSAQSIAAGDLAEVQAGGSLVLEAPLIELFPGFRVGDGARFSALPAPWVPGQ